MELRPARWGNLAAILGPKNATGLKGSNFRNFRADSFDESGVTVALGRFWPCCPKEKQQKWTGHNVQEMEQEHFHFSEVYARLHSEHQTPFRMFS